MVKKKAVVKKVSKTMKRSLPISQSKAKAVKAPLKKAPVSKSTKKPIKKTAVTKKITAVKKPIKAKAAIKAKPATKMTKAPVKKITKAKMAIKTKPAAKKIKAAVKAKPAAKVIKAPVKKIAPSKKAIKQKPAAKAVKPIAKKASAQKKLLTKSTSAQANLLAKKKSTAKTVTLTSKSKKTTPVKPLKKITVKPHKAEKKQPTQKTFRSEKPVVLKKSKMNNLQSEKTSKNSADQEVNIASTPTTNPSYMTPEHLAHFAEILRKWKDDLMAGVDKTIHHMQDEAANFADPNDRATQEEEFSLELRTRDRERKLMAKINDALNRIEATEYGFCDECGIEIGLERLAARPTATLCIDCKTLDEIREKQMAD